VYDQLQDAVTTAHETSTAFSDEVLKEHAIYDMSKKQEMKELLQTYADGQVEMFQRVSIYHSGKIKKLTT
jgi:sorting nexin-4